jgi:hypothetical protein
MNPSLEGALFAAAREEPAEKRAAFLDTICDGDAALPSSTRIRRGSSTATSSRRTASMSAQPTAIACLGHHTNAPNV